MGRVDHQGEGPAASCCSSSIDSNSHPIASLSSSSSKDLSIDLRLALTISPSPRDLSSTTTSPRQIYADWPPINALRRNTVERKCYNGRQHPVAAACGFYVKVYMEGLPIGRKLDLLAHDGYHSLLSTLSLMFNTHIICTNVDDQNFTESCHVLAYEDKEGDWMMVGDVPWEMFLATVKRLKITRADKC
ncbi:hypothetical protein Ancab_008526 [Ancistrocladus abbreviatus]